MRPGKSVVSSAVLPQVKRKARKPHCNLPVKPRVIELVDEWVLVFCRNHSADQLSLPHAGYAREVQYGLCADIREMNPESLGRDLRRWQRAEPSCACA